MINQVFRPPGPLSGDLASTTRKHQQPINACRATSYVDYAVIVAPDAKGSPRRSTAQATRASLLASATTATFLCTLAIKPRSQPPSGIALEARLGRAARAPWIRSLRRYLLPRFVMPISRFLLP